MVAVTPSWSGLPLMFVRPARTYVDRERFMTQPSAAAPLRNRWEHSHRASGGYPRLLLRLFVVDVVVLVAVCLVTVAVLSPQHATLSDVAAEEVAILLVALAGTLAVNLLLLRRALAPLEQLTAATRSVDGTEAGQRVEIAGPRSEATELAAAFNDMLRRLDEERQEARRRVLGAQEAERMRVAQELHDEVGQTLTALLLQLGRSARKAGPALAADLAEAQETARVSLEDVRRIALELRPEALDDLGLASALGALGERLSTRTGLRVTRRIDPDLPELDADRELVIYRVAQEALTNVVRHSESDHATVRLERSAGTVILRVRDHGRGLGDRSVDGGGGRGMRERAALVGGRVTVDNAPGGGVEVRLDVPLPGHSHDAA
jgi:two-component system, NarL family, sensor histidine kinase UhpB